MFSTSRFVSNLHHARWFYECMRARFSGPRSLYYTARAFAQIQFRA